MPMSPATLRDTMARPSAWAPLAMSGAALALVLVQLAVAGAARQADEGAVAHVWQLLMAGQLPVVAVFAFRWLPRSPRPAAAVLALQVCALLAAALPVLLLRW